MDWMNENLDLASGIPLESIGFYLDAVERDRLDQANPLRRSSEIMAIRQRLLRMSDQDYEAAIKAVWQLLGGNKPEGQDPSEKRQSRQRQLGQELFEESTGRPLRSKSENSK